MAQLCSCCDLPATHHFVVSYRGQVLRGAICEEHGTAVARERLGIQDCRGSLGSTKIGRALRDPNTKPHFQRIVEWEQPEIFSTTRGLTAECSSENGFSTRRRRSMSRSRRSRLRGNDAQPANADFEADFEPVVIPATVQEGPAALKPDDVHVRDPLLIVGGHGGNDGGVQHTTEDDLIRVKVVDAIKVLDRYAVPLEVGERKADQVLKQHGESIVRTTLRAAIKERRLIA